ncbi:hypothetical protein AMS68_006770 [Peltaster fructicola]|uniref:Methyltransferase domain-containing protein n=1 Tax=Peltaster fructicola TaxID=286661 RepID=A0A6H0Y2L1_9PEZI|nr:hypothetical protein AMS68_006770 [Peltaster fructicola]
MPSIPQRAQTDGSSTFDPDAFFEAWSKEELKPPYDNNFRKFIIKSFGLEANDTYGYRATAEVTLLQAQTYVDFGGQGGLHKWYLDGEGKQIPAPPAVDIAAYTDIFRATTNTVNALKGLASNAKKESIRSDVAKHLNALYQPVAAERKIVVPKSKAHINPYLDIWAWTNVNLEWAGPTESTVKVHHSHPILPIIFHHFGCVCPSYEALEVIRQVAKGRTIADIGSGNGFWTYMLRRTKDGKKNLDVVAIDNGISEWRTMWIGDTTETDGVKWLQQNAGGKEHVLLLVYPQVGLSFTSNTIAAYKGSTIIIAGSQNANGFTAFKELLTEWFAREMPAWSKVCQIPLPSFAGKDEALFVFERS